ncbi:L,D-transpeptidase [Paractinoplanes globisporus]|uniref:L,D-transpeptidase n=1 Tax=Paractinoplanes globisporus TaxID=113565 RepID=A0ABW6WIJ1_9ACTN|nr:L,D-transpeptidase [Actinoplanes globisporus]
MKRSRSWRSTATLVAFGLVLALPAGCGGSSKDSAARGGTASGGSSAGASAPPAASASASPTPAGKPVHVRLFQGDGSSWGVGMPIIAYLSAKITDAREFAAATTVTVNGEPADGAWFFQRSAIYSGYPIEAHYRLQNYWPAHAKIHMDLATKGHSAGTGMVFDNSLTLDMSTIAANISRIDGHKERMVVTSDGKQVFSVPVSLGKASTPTFSGVKVVMERDQVQRMTGPGYDLKVPWSVRITNSGEFVHSAAWNGGNIGQRSTSHGCTNLRDADAKRFFAFAHVGDVTIYTNTGGPTMPSWDGYGDWNLSWSTWQSGGLLHTT